MRLLFEFKLRFKWVKGPLWGPRMAGCEKGSTVLRLRANANPFTVRAVAAVAFAADPVLIICSNRISFTSVETVCGSTHLFTFPLFLDGT